MSTWLVIGKGPSARDFPRPPADVTTIGVNDCHPILGWEPDYLVVLDGHEKWPKDRRAVMDDVVQRVPVFTRAKPSHWQHARQRIPVKPRHVRTPGHDPPVCFKTDDGTIIVTICYTGAVSAVLLAIMFGATRVELIGVDFSDGYCLGDKPTLGLLNAMFDRMVRHYPDVEFVNLSPCSNLTAIRRAA